MKEIIEKKPIAGDSIVIDIVADFAHAVQVIWENPTKTTAVVKKDLETPAQPVLPKINK